EIKDIEGEVLFVGDGEQVSFDYLSKSNRWHENFKRLKFPLNVQHAKNTALIALKNINKALPPNKLMPIYLRMPQAERELKEKRSKNL
ncbi:MAG: hypothetical protein ACI4QE_02405, partial [Acutalibacteraceae bacterium]